VIYLSETLRNARLQLLADAMAGGTLTLYDAPRPATGGVITTQTALAEVEIPEGLTAVDSLLTLTLETTAIAVSDEAAWGRITSAADEFVADGDCGLLTSSAVFKLKTTYLQAGANLIPLLATFAES
jgi:hypothetical protein